MDHCWKTSQITVKKQKFFKGRICYKRGGKIRAMGSFHPDMNFVSFHINVVILILLTLRVKGGGVSYLR